MDIQIGDMLIQRSFERLWAVIEVEPDLVLRDPYGLRPDICMPPILSTSPDFDMIFKFAWHYEEAHDD